MSQSMSLNSAAGLSGMLKSGTSHYTESVLKNIDAANDLSRMVVSSFGPNGMNKLVVNHLEKIFITSDCSTIVRELEIEHPIAKILVEASTRQNEECGDGTNLVVSFAGELLKLTADLLRQGLHTSDVIAGYKEASMKLLDILNSNKLTIDEITDLSNEDQLKKLITPVLMSKQYGSHDILSPLVIKAAKIVMERPSDNQNKLTISPENIRIVKLLGSNVESSFVINGYIAQRGVESEITSVTSTKDKPIKIGIYACSIEASTTEAKGTVLMKNADDLKNYNISEEEKMEEIIKGIAECGVNVIVTGGNVSEMALHYINRYNILLLKIGSKWELRRLCYATGATALVRLGTPTPDEIGTCSTVSQKVISNKTITMFENNLDEKSNSKLSTIVIRASTSSLLQDLERSIDDSIHTIKSASKDGRLVGGAGSTEIELALQIQQYADTVDTLNQYSIKSFGKALEFVPRILSDNAGYNTSDVITKLISEHSLGHVTTGINIINNDDDEEEEKKDNNDNATSEVKSCNNIVDLLITKQTALRLAIDAAITILKVDQIIMSKQSGMKNQMPGMEGM